MALASTTDYQEILEVTLDPPATARVTRLLEAASQAVLAAYGQDILQATDTAVVIRPSDGLVSLPQRPVTAIGPVVHQGVTIPLAGVDPSAMGYRWTPGGSRQGAYLVRVVNGFDRGWRDPVTVTYTHGWSVIPAVVVMAVVMAAQAMGAQGDEDGRVLLAEQIDDHQRQFQAAPGGTYLPIPGWLTAQLDDLLGVPVQPSVGSVRTL